MTIDERIEALTTRNREIMSHQHETQGKPIDALTRRLEALTRDLEDLVPIVKGLVQVAEMHERRLTRLEDSPQ